MRWSRAWPWVLGLSSFLAARTELDALPAGVVGGCVAMAAWRGGTLRLEAPVGEGSDARVHRAAGAIVKLSRPSAEAAARVAREGALLERLRHPSLPRVIAMAASPTRAALVLADERATPLDRILARAPLPAGECARLAHDVLSALGALHAHGLAHRDVKPANILRRPDGSFMLIDLGAASAPTTLHGESGLVGTLLYMAPEQALGRADARSDLYASGLVLLHALTGEPPRPAHVGVRALADVATRRHALPPLPARWHAWLARCLAHDPEERFRDAHEALSAVGSLLQDEDAAADPKERARLQVDVATHGEATPIHERAVRAA